MRCLLVTVACCLAAGCESGGHFSVLGYSTCPNYDTCVKTVYVPIFENRTFRRGVEFDLTRAVVREIEAKTPFKVVSDRDKADTELSGAIVSYTKNIVNRNQLNEIREAETVLTVAVVWKDMRTGEILSRPKKQPAGGPAFSPLPDLAPGAGGVPTGEVVPPPLPPGAVALAVPLLATSAGTYIPEIGQSNATAQQINVNRLATQIVSLMEKPW